MANEELDIPIGDGTIPSTNELKFWQVTLKGSTNQRVVFIDTKGFGSFVKDEEERAFVQKMTNEIMRIENIYICFQFIKNNTRLSGSFLTCLDSAL